MANQPRTKIPVTDPGGLKAILEDKYGTVTAAARSLGVNQPTLHRLCTGKSRQMQYRIWLAVAEGLSDRRAQLERVVLSRDAQFQLDQWFRSLDRALAPIGVDVSLEEWPILGPARLGRSRSADPGDVELRELDEELAGQRAILLTAVLSGLCENPNYGPTLNQFIDWARRRGVEEARLMLALARVLEPVVPTDHIELWFVELHERGKLRRYLRLAIDRERLLLDRDPALSRAQAVAKRDWTDWYERLGGGTTRSRT
jgi:hypothetical protein